MTITDAQIQAASEVLSAAGHSVSPGTVFVALEVADKTAWRPIEDAPTDGTEILVTGVGGYNNCFFNPQKAAYRTCHPKAKGDLCWRNSSGYRVHPTHWRPLPAPPEVNE